MKSVPIPEAEPRALKPSPHQELAAWFDEVLPANDTAFPSSHAILRPDRKLVLMRVTPKLERSGRVVSLLRHRTGPAEILSVFEVTRGGNGSPQTRHFQFVNQELIDCESGERAPLEAAEFAAILREHFGSEND